MSTKDDNQWLVTLNLRPRWRRWPYVLKMAAKLVMRGIQWQIIIEQCRFTLTYEPPEYPER